MVGESAIPMIGTRELKVATQDAHRSLEKVLSFLQKDPSLRGYKQFLSRTFAFLATLEPQLRKFLPCMDAENRLSKTSWLESDLRALGLPLPRQAPRSALPRIDSKPEALGALYVFEGSTLGGSIIKQCLLASFSNIPLTYISSYGDTARKPKWDAFKKIIEEHWLSWNEHERQLAIESATSTFEHFELWQKDLEVLP